MSVTTSVGTPSGYQEIDVSGIEQQQSDSTHSRAERDCPLDDSLPAFDTLTDIRWTVFRQQGMGVESIRQQLSLDSEWSGVIEAIEEGERELDTNPIQADEVSNEIRAALLWEYLRSIQNVCPNPRLIPLKEESKEPKIVGQCKLDSDEATEMLHTPSEAVSAVRNGHPGFALYAGKERHNTENVVLIDHDDMEVFGLDTLPETLTIRSGSGGFHELFVSPDNDDIESSSGEWGEVRSHNWHCCVPGSIHGSGGVYHVSGLREPSILTESEVPERLEPSSGNRNGGGDERDFSPDDFTPSAAINEYENELDITLGKCRQHDPKLDAYFNDPYPEHLDTRDDSQIEAKLVWRLRYNYFSYDRIYDILPHRPRGRKEWKSHDESYIRRTVTESPTPEWRFTSADYVTGNDSPQYLALLPDVSSLNNDTHEATDDSTPSLKDVRDRRDEILRSVLDEQQQVLIDGIPSIGKSYGVIKVAAETGTSLVIFTARHDLYDQYEQWCDEHDLDCYTLGSFHHDCETANGTFGEEWREAVTDLYDSNVTGREIHKYAERYFGEQLPCDVGQECSWKASYDFDHDRYDVLVGHYTHAHNETLLENRTAVIDESCDDAFTEKYQKGTVSTAVNNYVKQNEIIPFDNYVDLTEHRDNPEKSRRVEGAKEWFIEEQGIERDSSLVLDGTDSSAIGTEDGCHADAPLLTYALLAAQDLGNGVEYTPLGRTDNACRNRTTESIHIRRPPDFSEADGVICLDGTPSKKIWESSVGEELEHIQVLSDDERTGYLTDEYGLTVIQTSDTPKPYSAKHRNYLTPQKDHHLLDEIHEQTGRDPPITTPNQALLEYEQSGIIDAERASMNFAQTKSSNEFSSEEIGIVLGSTHYGDGSIKEECALHGESVERVSNTKGNNLRYTTELGNEVLEAQREAGVFQATMRYGRKPDKNPTTFVHSSSLPEWVPVEEKGDVIEVSDGMREVLYAIAAIDAEPQFDKTFKTKNVAHRVNIGENSARNHLETLMEYGYLEKERPKNAIQWTITRLPFDPFDSDGESPQMETV